MSSLVTPTSLKYACLFACGSNCLPLISIFIDALPNSMKDSYGPFVAKCMHELIELEQVLHYQYSAHRLYLRVFSQLDDAYMHGYSVLRPEGGIPTAHSAEMVDSLFV